MSAETVSARLCQIGIWLKEDPTVRLQGILLFLLVNLVGLSFLDSTGTPDVAMRLGSIQKMETLGVRSGLEASRQDYPPLGIIVRDAAAKFSNLLGLDVTMGYQLAIALFLVITSVVLLLWTRSLIFVSAMQLALTLNSMVPGI